MGKMSKHCKTTIITNGRTPHPHPSPRGEGEFVSEVMSFTNSGEVKTKKAITLAEIIIVMVIVATIALVFIAMPKKDVGKIDRTKYYVAYDMLSRLQNEQMAENGRVCIKKQVKDNYIDITNESEWEYENCSFDNQVKKWLNTVGEPSGNQVKLTNGMILNWKNYDYNDTNHYLNVVVDIDGSGGPNQTGKDQHTFTLWNKDGRVTPDYKSSCSAGSTDSYCTTDWISFRVFRFGANGNMIFEKTNASYSVANECLTNTGTNACADCAGDVCFMEPVPTIK